MKKVFQNFLPTLLGFAYLMSSLMPKDENGDTIDITVQPMDQRQALNEFLKSNPQFMDQERQVLDKLGGICHGNAKAHLEIEDVDPGFLAENEFTGKLTAMQVNDFFRTAILKRKPQDIINGLANFDNDGYVLYSQGFVEAYSTFNAPIEEDVEA
jgi:hypothetical protein